MGQSSFRFDARVCKDFPASSPYSSFFLHNFICRIKTLFYHLLGRDLLPFRGTFCALSPTIFSSDGNLPLWRDSIGRSVFLFRACLCFFFFSWSLSLAQFFSLFRVIGWRLEGQLLRLDIGFFVTRGLFTLWMFLFELPPQASAHRRAAFFFELYCCGRAAPPSEFFPAVHYPSFFSDPATVFICVISSVVIYL